MCVESLKEFIKENKLAEENAIGKEKADTYYGEFESEEIFKVNHNDREFFVNTKFHFENNSWTWVNGGQIKADEWHFIPGTNQKYPVIPIQV